MKKIGNPEDERNQNQTISKLKMVRRLLGKLKADSNRQAPRNKDSAFFVGIDLGDKKSTPCKKEPYAQY
jgi:hypothetical protein